MKHDIPSLDNKGLRGFGLLTGALLVVLGGWLIPWLRHRPFPLWPWMISGILWVWALVWPAGLNVLYQMWMKVGHILGWVNTRVILVVFFYLVLLPTGLVKRMFTADPLARKMDNHLNTYRVKSHPSSRERMERPF